MEDARRTLRITQELRGAHGEGERMGDAQKDGGHGSTHGGTHGSTDTHTWQAHKPACTTARRRAACQISNFNLQSCLDRFVNLMHKFLFISFAIGFGALNLFARMGKCYSVRSPTTDI